MNNDIYQRALELQTQLIDYRRHLHQCPEIGFDLDNTAEYVKKSLQAIGVNFVEIEGNGILVTIQGKGAGDVVLLRADMDALPIQEESGLPFASTNGNAHACGHDMHTSMLLGAAIILNERKDQFKGTVKLIFQPAEEILSGAKKMIEQGIMKNPQVDVSFGMHVIPDIPVGTFGTFKGASHASSDIFEITVNGKGCHGAMPHLGVDPINVACHIHTALQEIISRNIITTQSAVLTVGQFNAGNAANVIPNQTIMRGTVRTKDDAIRNKIIERMKTIVEHTAKAFDADATLRLIESIPCVSNDPEVVDFVRNSLNNLGREGITLIERTTMGSENFAFYGQASKSAFISIGAGAQDKSSWFPIHNPKVLFNEDCLHIGAAVHANFAIKWLNKV